MLFNQYHHAMNMQDYVLQGDSEKSLVNCYPQMKRIL